MKNILLILLCLLGLDISAQMAEPNETWQAYTTLDDVTIEYKSFETIKNGREVSLVVLRFSNLSSDEKQIKFNREIYRGGECFNCNTSYQSDNIQSINLLPNEVLSGETVTNNSATRIFNQFLVKVPGMTAKPISGFEITNLLVTTN